MSISKEIILKYLGWVLILVAVIIAAILALEASAPRPGIVDLSWPNCDNLPSGTFDRGIVGVNGGLDFHPNPCAGNEAREFSVFSVYANSGDPGFPRVKQKGSGPLRCRSNNLVCYSYNYGYQAALYSIRQAELANLHVEHWWIDVETVNSWTSSKNANRANIEGMIAALARGKGAVSNVGIYSTANQWHALMGHWEIKLPLWLGTGEHNARSAANACKEPAFSDGPVVLSQYTSGALDFNLLCPSGKLNTLF